jgi:hypothetical protein
MIERLLWCDIPMLITVSWNIKSPIEQDVLQVLLETTPHVRLYVEQRQRNHAILDQTLLSSPQLHSLDTTVYYFPNHPTTVMHAHSELQILKRCLVQGNNIKKLRIAFQNAGSQKVLDEAGAKRNLALWEHGPLNFHWKDGAQFPGLQVLAWRGDVPCSFSNT